MNVTIQTQKNGAFKRVEWMMVIVILGLLAAAILPHFIGKTRDAKIRAAREEINELDAALEKFYAHMDRYPTAEEGLKVLVEPPAGEEEKNWRGPYLKQLRNDPWGNPIQYRYPGTHHPSTCDIWSRGEDGRDGGEGNAADIGNW